MNRVLVIVGFVMMINCSGKKSTDSSVKFEQYYVQGQELYLKHCANCHQPEGTGLGLVFPPLNKSDFMDNNLEQVLCLMKYGVQGELVVNGQTFNQPMPGVPSLTDLEIAEIATYIYNSWEHKRGLVEVSKVRDVMNDCPQ
jgi:cytochrome c551